MSLTIGIKVFSDLCLYFAFAGGIFARPIEGMTPAWGILLCAAGAALGAALDRRRPGARLAGLLTITFLKGDVEVAGKAEVGAAPRVALFFWRGAISECSAFRAARFRQKDALRFRAPRRSVDQRFKRGVAGGR